MIKWKPVLSDASSWVSSQPYAVTLRQVFYHLVATGLIPNRQSTYKTLSAKTADLRRVDEFPDLADGTREIMLKPAWVDLSDYAIDAAEWFGLDRTEGQDCQVIIGLEKRGMVTAASQQFMDRGFSVVALGGYGSATIDKLLAEQIHADGRKAVLLYAGDFDASGEDIYRNLLAHVPFSHAEKVALTLEQVTALGLPINPGKDTDSRADEFAAKYGTNMQVEVDALEPAFLADLFETAVAPFWDESLFDEIVEREAEMKDEIRDRLSR